MFYSEKIRKASELTYITTIFALSYSQLVVGIEQSLALNYTFAVSKYSLGNAIFIICMQFSSCYCIYSLESVLGNIITESFKLVGLY